MSDKTKVTVFCKLCDSYNDLEIDDDGNGYEDWVHIKNTGFVCPSCKKQLANNKGIKPMSNIYATLRRKATNDDIFELVLFTTGNAILTNISCSIKPLPHIFTTIGLTNPVFETNVLTKDYPAVFDVFTLGFTGGIDQDYITLTVTYQDENGLCDTKKITKLSIQQVKNALKIGESYTSQQIAVFKEIKSLLQPISRQVCDKLYAISEAIRYNSNSSNILYNALLTTKDDRFALKTGCNNARFFVIVNGQPVCIFHTAIDRIDVKLSYSQTYNHEIKNEIAFNTEKALEVLKKIKEEVLEESDVKHIGDRAKAIEFLDLCLSVCEDFPNGIFVFNVV